MADRAGLASDAAAGNGRFNIDLAEGSGGDQRLADDQLQGVETEVLLNVTTVDRDGAGAVGIQVHARDGGLSAAGAVHIGFLALISCHRSIPPS